MAAESDPASRLKGAEVVIMDPPRKGIEPELMRALQVWSEQTLTLELLCVVLSVREKETECAWTAAASTPP